MWTRRQWVIVCLAVLGGMGMLSGALALTGLPWEEWAASVLISGGAAVVLVVPFYVLTKGLDRHIEQVRVQAASNVEALTERVAAFEGDVERRLEDVVQTVTSRLEDERAQDRRAFEALAETPSRAAFEEAMRRAMDRGLVSPHHGPRVCVSENWDVFVRIDYETEHEDSWTYDRETVEFVVEDAGGEEVQVVPWPEGQPVDDVMVALGRALERVAAGGEFAVGVFLRGLAETLHVAASSPRRRPIIQPCPPQWAILDWGVVSYGSSPFYSLTLGQLRSRTIQSHMASKSWVDADCFEDAMSIALALNPHTDDEPIF
jgi:hypothetical protein